MQRSLLLSLLWAAACAPNPASDGGGDNLPAADADSGGDAAHGITGDDDPGACLVGADNYASIVCVVQCTGQVVCESFNIAQGPVSELEGAVQIAVSRGAHGTGEVAVIDAAGALVAVAIGSDGTRTPETLAFGGTATAIVGGDSHMCVLDDASRAWCWGRNDAGQLGPGGTQAVAAPDPIELAVGPVTQVVAGGHSTCFIGAADGKVSCVGSYAGTAAGQPEEVAALDGALRLWSGGTEPGTGLCGELVGGRLLCPHLAVDEVVSGLRDVVLSDEHACAVDDVGAVSCWGQVYDYGTLQYTDPDPTPVAWGTVAGVSGYSHRMCARGPSTLWCWGGNTWDPAPSQVWP